MDNILITYSLIKNIYDEKKDYLDVFVPFVLNSFPENVSECTKNIILKGLEEKFGLIIPEYTFNAIITRATKTGYLSKSERKCLILTEKGERLIKKIHLRFEETQRQINALIVDIKNFITSSYNNILTEDRIRNELISFIKQYQAPLISFFSPNYSIEKKTLPSSSNKQIEYFLFEYFKVSRREKPNEFNILRDLFYGAIISTITKRENIGEINKKFSRLIVFLDTNFIFSIMNLHYSYISKPAKELFELLKKYKFQIKIFDFTINEIVRVLKGYLIESYKYFPNVRVDSIYGNLKHNLKWSETDCKNFIVKIEETLLASDIQIEYTGIDNLTTFGFQDERYSRIIQYKPEQNSLGQKHDILAIEKIREKREKRPQRKIEDCVALFLTSDQKLTQFDFIEMGHRENSTIPEVILDRFLTTLLWLKNPEWSKELPLEMILATQSELLISRDIWDKFYETLMKLKNEKRISEEDISVLIYHQELGKELTLINKPDEIKEELILSEIENAKKKIDEKTQQKIVEETERLKKELEKKYADEMDKKQQEHLQQLENIKKNIKDESIKIANLIAYIKILIPLFSLLLLGIILLIKNSKIWGTISLVIGIISFFCQLLDIKFNIFNWRTRIRDHCFNKIYIKKLKKLGLSEK